MRTFCLGADEHYFQGLVVATLSTLQALDPSLPYHFLILDGGLRIASWKRLERAMLVLAEQRGVHLTVERVELDLSAFDELPKIWGRSAMTYARILLPSVTQADSILWIDADMMLFRDLSKFKPTRPERCLLAGVQDSYIRFLERDSPIQPTTWAQDTIPYLNAGLLWMNLERMRREDYKGEVLRFLNAHKDSLGFWDQTALNHTSVHATEVLPETWNVFCLDGSDKTLVQTLTDCNLHMVSQDKPWLGMTDPEIGPQPARDMVFWKLWGHFTGESIDGQIARARGLFSARDLRRARWKRWTYRLGRNAYRERKWRELELYYQRVGDGSLERDIDRRLADWLQRTSPPKAGVHPAGGVFPEGPKP